MLLTGYRLEIFKSKCDTEATGVHCFAHLRDDISAVLPFLNSVLGAFVYISNPPSLMLKNYGKLITLEARKIAVNALKGEEEAEKIAMQVIDDFQQLIQPGIVHINGSPNHEKREAAQAISSRKASTVLRASNWARPKEASFCRVRTR